MNTAENTKAKQEQIRNLESMQYALDAVREEKICQARERHGKPFAHEKNSDWVPRAVPVLTEWLQSQKREEKK